MKPNPIAGQWVGDTTGSSAGGIVLNVDADRQLGVWLNQHVDPAIEAIGAIVHFEFESDSFSGTSSLAFNPYEPLSERQRGSPTEISLTGRRTGNTLSGDWHSDVGTRGTFQLKNIEDEESLPADETFESWDDFERWVRERRAAEIGLIYRGHDDAKHKLRTSFHRTGRRSLVRYDVEDLQILYRVLAPHLHRRFDLSDRVDFTSFLFLARHHGYPTPLLDWTESHYIALFFAFSQGDVPTTAPTHVRLLEFDPLSWNSPSRPTPSSLYDPRLVLGDLWAIPFQNIRALPQQSRLLFSNIVEIEKHVADREADEGFRYLLRVNLDYRLREEVLDRLRYIGITPATMFPGIDGTCRALAQQYF